MRIVLLALLLAGCASDPIGQARLNEQDAFAVLKDWSANKTPRARPSVLAARDLAAESVILRLRIENGEPVGPELETVNEALPCLTEAARKLL